MPPTEARTAPTAKLRGRCAVLRSAPATASNPALAPILYVYNYLKEVVGEQRKVIWPNRKQMVTYTAVVLAFLVFMVALVAGADFAIALLVLLVFGE